MSASDRVPVVIFLYDDYSAMPRSEADHFVDELLKTCATVHGLRDIQAPRIYESRWLGGEQHPGVTFRCRSGCIALPPQ